jgi:predicted ATP-dependent endonuclease of OLD family
MKISSLTITNFKRFSRFSIVGLPPKAKLILLVGPNGSGKSSLFDAFIHYYRMRVGYGIDGDETYYRKDLVANFDWGSSVDIRFHNNSEIHKKSFYFRSAYRNEPDFNVDNFSKTNLPYEALRIGRTIQNEGHTFF